MERPVREKEARLRGHLRHGSRRRLLRTQLPRVPFVSARHNDRGWVLQNKTYIAIYSSLCRGTSLYYLNFKGFEWNSMP